MKRGAIAIVALLVSLLSEQAALAAFHRGDIIVSTVILNFVGPNGSSYTGTIRQFAPAGSLISQFYSQENGGASDLKFSPSGVLHGAAGTAVLRFANDGSMLSPLVAPSTSYLITSLAFTRSGVLFATTQGGEVVKFAGDGSSLGLISGQSQAPTWADLSIDQCTLYGLTVQIRRLDVCGGTLLVPLTPPLGDFGRTLLVLPDRTLLASTSHADMYRVRSDGSILRHYATHAVAFSRDLSPNFVWVAVGARFAKFDLENDVIASGPFNTDAEGIIGITVVDADAQSIPEFSPVVLMLLVLVVVAFALSRLRY